MLRAVAIGIVPEAAPASRASRRLGCGEAIAQAVSGFNRGAEVVAFAADSVRLAVSPVG
jgi:hypothetical protein